MPKLDRSTAPALLRDFRRHAGLSQRQLAALLGVTTDKIGDYERQGGPGWLPLALFGVAYDALGYRAEVAAHLTGITPTRELLDRVPLLPPPTEPR